MNTKKPLSIAIGTLAAVSFSLAACAGQSDNPFEVEDLSEGTIVASVGDPKDKDKDKDEGKCGEGKCGEGSCGEDDDEDDEGKCGEGSCGAV